MNHLGWRESRPRAKDRTNQDGGASCGRVLMALLSSLSLLGLASTAQADEPPILYPQVAGTTVIHGEGVVGITMMLSEDSP